MAGIEYTGTKWVGIGTPLFKGKNGLLTFKYTKQLVLSSIFHILSTPLGTRLMRPDFGSVFPELLFEPNDSVLVASIEVNVREDILKWEPRIRELRLIATPKSKDLEVKLLFSINETGEKVNSYLNAQRNNLQSLRLI